MLSPKEAKEISLKSMKKVPECVDLIIEQMIEPNIKLSAWRGLMGSYISLRLSCINILVENTPFKYMSSDQKMKSICDELTTRGYKITSKRIKIDEFDDDITFHVNWE